MEQPVLGQMKPDNLFEPLIVHLVVIRQGCVKIAPLKHVGNDVPLDRERILRRKTVLESLYASCRVNKLAPKGLGPVLVC